MEKNNITYYMNVPHGNTSGIISYRVEDKDRLAVIPPGIYIMKYHNVGPMTDTPILISLEEKDKLINFEGGAVSEVLNETDKFFSEEVINGYKSMQMCHKMAIILSGGHGTGKTSTAMLAMRKACEKYKCICIDFTGIRHVDLIINYLDNIRSHQDNKIIAFIDEFDTAILRDETGWLPFLDGNYSIDGLMLIGCTNYLDKIPDRIKNRKSRVKRVIKIETLPFEVYKQYILEKVPDMEEEKVNKLAYLSGEKGLVIDQLKNVLINHKIYGIPLKKAIEEVNYEKPGEEEEIEDF